MKEIERKEKKSIKVRRKRRKENTRNEDTGMIAIVDDNLILVKK
jgi:hypothetical protein